MSRPSSRPVETLRGAARLDDLITETAWLYYQDNLNQTEIADRLQISRASVVNYLSEARLRGWVRLYMDSEVFLGHRLAADLCAAYGLKQALIVDEGAAPETGRDAGSGSGAGTGDTGTDTQPPPGYGDEARITRAAADWLPRLLAPGDRLGVSWGETVHGLAQRVARHQVSDLTVVQLVGSRPAAPGFAAETCTTILAQQLGARCVNLHVPLLLSDRDLADRLRAEPVVRDQLRAVASCNKTVLACGTCDDDAHIARTGLQTPESLATQRANGAVGVICGRLIDAQGRAVPSQVEERMIGVTLDQMRGKETALLIASGPGRAAPARAAILGGYVTHIATSVGIARALLADPP